MPILETECDLCKKTFTFDRLNVFRVRVNYTYENLYELVVCDPCIEEGRLNLSMNQNTIYP